MAVGTFYPGPEEAIRRARAAAAALADSRYPAIRRAVALRFSASMGLYATMPDDADRKQAERDLDAALALVKESAESDERNPFWNANWADTLNELTRGYRVLGVPAEAAHERVDAALAGVPDARGLRLFNRGNFWFGYGWEARTEAFAPDVPEGGFEALEKRLAIAREAFEEAWKVQPGSDETACRLMEIDKAVGGDRDTMELWFERALKANGDDRESCWSKLEWLDPKWHGSVEEMLAFGRACRDTKNSRTGITLLAADAHWRIAAKLGKYQRKYLALPEVWADIQSVYDEYLKHHPVDDVARSKYAVFSYLAGHHREAEVQFVALGDRLMQWRETPYVPLAQMKQNRTQNAEIVIGKRGDHTFPGWHFVAAQGDQGEWRVNIPVGAPHVEKPGLLGAEATHVWECSAGGVAYRIRVLELPPSLQKEGPERVLEAGRALVARELGAPPRNLRDTLLAARPTLEYDVDPPGTKPLRVRVKSIVLGNWFVELSVTASARDVNGREAREFFDSFAYQPRPQRSPEAVEP
jgi:hypothetical protein